MESKKSNILIVDDTQENIQVLGNMLKSHSCNLFMAMDGATALKITEQKKIDLILLDIMMPEMDGFEVCQKLKKNPQTQHIPVIFLSAKNATEDIVKGINLGAVDYISKPFEMEELFARVNTHIELNLLRTDLEQKVEDRTKELKQAHQELHFVHGKLQEAYLEIIRRLAIVSDYRDNETGMHIQRMSKYCETLGREIGLDEELVKALVPASTMHDVGKIGIPDAILLKPGKLDQREFEVMKTHTLIGKEILTGINSKVAQLAAEIAETHHEKFDGTGYPNQLKEDQIPIEGRICAVADVFDALISKRPYKKPWPVEDAVELIRNQRGQHFDPVVVDCFMEQLPEIIKIKEKYED